MTFLDKHHLIPLSLFGLDHGCNLVYVPRWQHQMIHKTMNIKKSTYTSMYRTFRRRHNHKTSWDEDQVRDILNMQMAYLNNWHKLPIASQLLHIQKMREILVHYAKLVDDKVAFTESSPAQDEWTRLMKKYSELFLRQVQNG